MQQFTPHGRHRHRDRGRRGEPDVLWFGPWQRRVFEGRPGPGMRRGEVRPLILAALTRKPMHGYEVIQELERESGGRWRPSAGSVYPTLQQLADEGLVTSREEDGRRTYELTDAGRAAAQEAPIGPDAWARRPGWSPRNTDDLGPLAAQLAGAVIQVERMGSPKARDEARAILIDARKRIYRLLAEDDTAAGSEAEPESGEA